MSKSPATPHEPQLPPSSQQQDVNDEEDVGEFLFSKVSTPAPTPANLASTPSRSTAYFGPGPFRPAQIPMTPKIAGMNLEEQMASLVQQLNDLRRTNRELYEQQQQLALSSRVKEPRIAMPERFDGTKTEYRGFVNQVRQIISLHPNRYPTGRAQVGLIGSLLTKTASAWFAPLVEQSSPLLDDLDSFLAEFESTFGDPDRSHTSALKLRNLKQGNRPASAYAADFRLLTCDVPWDEAALVDQFRSGLASDVKDLLLTMPDANTLSLAMTQAIRCDNRLFERRRERRLEIPGRSELTRSAATGTSAFSSGPMASNPAIPGGKFQKLTEAEKQRRRTNNLCMYCGEAGHFSRDCPNKKVPRSMAHVAQVNSQGPATVTSTEVTENTKTQR
jgi:hypothetical protein